MNVYPNSTVQLTRLQDGWSVEENQRFLYLEDSGSGIEWQCVIIGSSG